jgi:uncharacterized protein YdeI (BOF family)
MQLSDTQLLKISLCISAFGLLGLFIIFSFSELPATSIQDAEALLDGEDIRIEGNILSVNQRGNTTFLIIEQQCTIDVIVFDPIELEEGRTVSIIGTLDSYNNKREVLVEEIHYLS